MDIIVFLTNVTINNQRFLSTQFSVALKKSGMQVIKLRFPYILYVIY